tara:strand:- start:714 stop:944 length:231 start_codon:yes stop_codon:yes gene_type:complete
MKVGDLVRAKYVGYEGERQVFLITTVRRLEDHPFFKQGGMLCPADHNRVDAVSRCIKTGWLHYIVASRNEDYEVIS